MSERLRRILEEVSRGERSVSAALEAWRSTELHATEAADARLDHDRDRRCGDPEVIYAAGKSPQQVQQIFQRLAEHHDRVMATRAEPAAFAAVRELVPEARYHERARAITYRKTPVAEAQGLVGILAAGTSDIPVAEEAQVTAEWMGAQTFVHYDVGVAGLHRLLAVREDLARARVLVVVAGMEGALPSVVGGLVSCPVIAVPTSVGYGASFAGLSALLGMLNSCAAGLAVVNIDNGFGAGTLAARINRMGQSA